MINEEIIKKFEFELSIGIFIPIDKENSIYCFNINHLYINIHKTKEEMYKMLNEILKNLKYISIPYTESDIGTIGGIMIDTKDKVFMEYQGGSSFWYKNEFYFQQEENPLPVYMNYYILNEEKVKLENENKGSLPIADRISSWGSEKERKILFKCPKCEMSFGYYEENEKFCHNCGEKINWKDIKYNLINDADLIMECTNNYKKHKEIIDKINELNSKGV